MTEESRPNKDLTSFLNVLLNDYEAGAISREQYIAAHSEAYTLAQQGDKESIDTWLRQGRKLIRLDFKDMTGAEAHTFNPVGDMLESPERLDFVMGTLQKVAEHTLSDSEYKLAKDIAIQACQETGKPTIRTLVAAWITHPELALFAGKVAGGTLPGKYASIFRADGGDLSTGRITEIANNAYGDEEKRRLAQRLLAAESELQKYKPVGWRTTEAHKPMTSHKEIADSWRKYGVGGEPVTVIQVYDGPQPLTPIDQPEDGNYEFTPLYASKAPFIASIIPEKMELPDEEGWENKMAFMEMFGRAIGWNNCCDAIEKNANEIFQDLMVEKDI